MIFILLLLNSSNSYLTCYTFFQTLFNILLFHNDFLLLILELLNFLLSIYYSIIQSFYWIFCIMAIFLIFVISDCSSFSIWFPFFIVLYYQCYHFLCSLIIFIMVQIKALSTDLVSWLLLFIHSVILFLLIKLGGFLHFPHCFSFTFAV